jgi:hypothetical protein
VIVIVLSIVHHSSVAFTINVLVPTTSETSKENHQVVVTRTQVPLIVTVAQGATVPKRVNEPIALLTVVCKLCQRFRLTNVSQVDPDHQELLIKVIWETILGQIGSVDSAATIY